VASHCASRASGQDQGDTAAQQHPTASLCGAKASRACGRERTLRPPHAPTDLARGARGASRRAPARCEGPGAAASPDMRPSAAGSLSASSAATGSRLGVLNTWTGARMHAGAHDLLPKPAGPRAECRASRRCAAPCGGPCLHRTLTGCPLRSSHTRTQPSSPPEASSCEPSGASASARQVTAPAWPDSGPAAAPLASTDAHGPEPEPCGSYGASPMARCRRCTAPSPPAAYSHCSAARKEWGQRKVTCSARLGWSWGMPA
jgi:hypothetical protein